jgi:hypothetical protein
MKFPLVTLILAALICPPAVLAVDQASDLAAIGQAQDQVLELARAALERAENPGDRQALETAIKEMQSAKSALEDAKKTPSKLPAAVAAEQAAFQTLLKLIPHEFQISRSRGRGGGAGQPSRGQIDQLEMTSEEDRYETERQATPTPTAKQRDQLQIADRLKALAQRQQDLNDRLRELQTALQEARTDAERQDLQRQLKRLEDEERQMLADEDELRQQVDQSSAASSMSKARQQLEQARSDTQRAAQEIGNESVSQALAAGTRAQQGLRDLREQMRSQTSTQFADQMRQLRSQARDLARQEEEIGHSLESLAHPEKKTLNDDAQRQQLIQRMDGQQKALTNLVAGMENVGDQAENTEPLLAKQLYDAGRRAGQMHTDNLLQTGEMLVDRGLLTQAAGPERAARKNIGELRDRVEHAAESVLGNETEALRFAQKELDDLSAQVEREAAGAGTNTAGQNTNAAVGNGAGGADNLREMVQQFGAGHGAGGNDGPVTGSDFLAWTDRARDVEEVLDSPDLRSQLAAVREHVGALRAEFRRTGRKPDGQAVRVQVLDPLTEVRAWLRQELARREDANSLVPLDHDPVPENYSDLVRQYYEKLGGGK